MNKDEIKQLIDEKVENAIVAIKEQISAMSSDFSSKLMKLVSNQESEKPTMRYADIVKSKAEPALIIQPKNTNQQVKQTKTDILKHVQPNQDVQLAKVKTARDGGLIIGCRTKEDTLKLKKMIQEKMAGSYEVRDVTGVYPRIRVVGMSEKYSNEDLQKSILSGNSHMFTATSECKVIKVYPTKKNADVFQATVQVDKESYERILKNGNLFVALDSCSVFDALEVHRCFTCNEYDHSSRKCKKPVVCPVCAENHELKQCRSKSQKCCNCTKLSQKDGNIAVNHAVWDKQKCLAYSEALDKLRQDLFASKR
nr:unnamed protein product [Callosobruchus analis]